jgi:protease-4
MHSGAYRYICRAKCSYMNPFFRTFFASLLALFVFSILSFVITIVFLIAVSATQKVETGKKAVLLIDLSNRFPENEEMDPFAKFMEDENSVVPSLSHLTTMIHHAKNDGSVEGIFLKCEQNNNDFGASESIWNALRDFRSSGKFVIASANTIPQRAYYVASAASKVYCNPIGGVEWTGFSVTMPFLKGTLEKMEIEPQIFYAGKFKSATEPLRERQMTEANRLQTTELLNDLYAHFLQRIGDARKIDTASLRKFADSNMVQFAAGALKYRLVDGLKYDDEVKNEIRKGLKIGKDEKINFVTPGKYRRAVNYMPDGSKKIAVIYAEGNIMDGTGDRGRIGGDSYRNIIRKARMDDDTKAIVLRINSGGGSAMASEIIWREVMLAKKVKPVIVSFGDVAASGGYYIACGADQIFAEPNTITGSIGVFGVLPNMKSFFNNKLGVTFDEVKTSPDAGMFNVTRPLNAAQKQYFQNWIDTIYFDFKSRVAEGRKRSLSYVDSIAQGRVWSGKKALEIGLVDKLGGLDDAIEFAAAKAGIKDWRLREYPDEPGLFEMLKNESESGKETMIKKELGEQAYQVFRSIREISRVSGTAQARLPFEIIIE